MFKALSDALSLRTSTESTDASPRPPAAEDGELADFAHLLFGYALLAEGSEIVEPVRFNRALVDLMAKAG